jgi:hypothetical protein
MEKAAIVVSIFIGLLAVFTIGLVISIPLGLGFPFSGEHTGYITAVERGGLLNIPTVYIKTDLESSQEDSYCLSDNLYDQARALSKERVSVTVKFERGWFMPFWQCNSANYRVVGIEAKN